MNNTQARFDYERFYHVYNRTNNKEVLFKNSENKKYFLRLINDRLKGYVKFYAFALLENHFHFAISICSEIEIISYIKSIPFHDQRKTEMAFVESTNEPRDIHTLISRQWSRVFNSYTQAINKKHDRKGHLFHTPFKRSFIKADSKLSLLIYYIHHNSRKHGIVSNFIFDKWHSYHTILFENSSFVERDFIFEWFGGKDAFISFHEEKHLERDFTSFWIE